MCKLVEAFLCPVRWLHLFGTMDMRDGTTINTVWCITIDGSWLDAGSKCYLSTMMGWTVGKDIPVELVQWGYYEEYSAIYLGRATPSTDESTRSHTVFMSPCLCLVFEEGVWRGRAKLGCVAYHCTPWRNYRFFSLFLQEMGCVLCAMYLYLAPFYCMWSFYGGILDVPISTW